jgi:hypothetical protein
MILEEILATAPSYIYRDGLVHRFRAMFQDVALVLRRQTLKKDPSDMQMLLFYMYMTTTLTMRSGILFQRQGPAKVYSLLGLDA